MRFKNKLHYALKYLVLGLPVILLIISSFVVDNSVYLEITGNLQDLANELVNLSNSSWYLNILEILGFNYDDFSIFGFVLIIYPLYVFWVYMFDLMLDIITWLLRLFHDMLYEGLERRK